MESNVLTSPQPIPETQSLPEANKNKAVNSSGLKKQIKPLYAWLIILSVLFIGASVMAYVIVSQPKVSSETSLPIVLKKPLFLNLASPTDESIVQDGQVTVKGKTLPDTTVVFFTEEDQNSVESDTAGNFEGTISLMGGLNTLTVTAFDAKGEEKTVNMSVVYDDEAVLGVKTAKKEPPGQAKKEEKANIGGVENVTNNSITVENKGKKTKVETLVDENTTIINQDKKKIKLNAVKLKDLAAVISTSSATATDSGKVKKALKVYIREANTVAQMKRRAVYGLISDVSGDLITIVHPVHQERVYQVTIGELTVIKLKGITNGTMADLVIGQRIAVVGDLNEVGGIIAKRVHVIPGEPVGLTKRYLIRDQDRATLSGTISITPPATISATPTATSSATPTEILHTPTPES